MDANCVAAVRRLRHSNAFLLLIIMSIDHEDFSNRNLKKSQVS